jgi:FAD/FMN-containing dehydrogenase
MIAWSRNATTNTFFVTSSNCYTNLVSCTYFISIYQMTIAEELRDILKGDVLDDEKTLLEYSRDASLFVVKPELVVFPKDTSDIKNLVGFVLKNKKKHPGLSLTARSAGTDMSGGPLSESIVLGFQKYFNRTPIINIVSKTAIVQPGVFYRIFERETLKHNLLFPPYPASKMLCAMGGIINNNSGGEKTLKYGKTIDYVQEIRAVLADGNEYVLKPLTEKELNKKIKKNDFEGKLYGKLHKLITKNYDLIKNAKPKVSKNSAGYNLWDVWNKEAQIFDVTKLFVGSQGTLGITTEATLRLVQPSKYSQMMIVFLKNLDDLGEIINETLKFGPTTFESYDDKTLKLAIRFAREFAKRLGAGTSFTILKKSLGEIFSILIKGFPKLVLQITFEGDNPDQLLSQARELKKIIKNYKPQYLEIIKTPEEAEGYWLIRRESFSLLREKVKNKKTAPFVDDIVVSPEKLLDFLPGLNNILEEYDITYTVAGHVGDGNFHIIPLMNLEDENQRQIIPELSKRVYDLVLKYEGSITGEHNDGLIRSPYLRQMYGEEVYKLFEETKKIFDPKNIFNPGKKVGSSLEYAIQHIRKN